MNSRDVGGLNAQVSTTCWPNGVDDLDALALPERRRPAAPRRNFDQMSLWHIALRDHTI
jgi:hypothetical protein